jgi:hypothetical protein
MNLTTFELAAASSTNAWGQTLTVALAVSAALAFGYRVYRLGKGGPIPDAIGGAVLAVILVAVGVLWGTGAEWSRWIALVYAVVFGLIAMPVWTLGVFIPSRPGAVDYAFICAYWASLVLIAAAVFLA